MSSSAPMDIFTASLKSSIKRHRRRGGFAIDHAAVAAEQLALFKEVYGIGLYNADEVRTTRLPEIRQRLKIG